jgi:WXXGXW repeat (2 copies)
VPQNRCKKGSLLAGLALSVSLAGCVVEPARVGFTGGVVVAEPPAPIVEEYGVAPAPGLVWTDGYWNWVGGRHVWVAGHWLQPPHRGYRWEPHQWVRVQGGWQLREGHWARARR